MRALILLTLLCLATSLQAAELESARPDGGSGCNERPAETVSAGGPLGSGHGEAERGGVTGGGTPEAASGSTRGDDRNRMSQRWHSLLPGMFR